MAAVTQLNLAQLFVVPIGTYDYSDARNCVRATLTETCQPGDFLVVTNAVRNVQSIPPKNNYSFNLTARKALTGETPTGMIVTNRSNTTDTPPQAIRAGEVVEIMWGLMVSYQSPTFVSAPFASNQYLYLSSTVPGRMDTEPSEGNETAIAFMPGGGMLYIFAPGTGSKAVLP